MKMKSILGISLLAVCGMFLAAQSARAQAVDGDLILGFEAYSGTATGNNLEVNLGSFEDPISSVNLSSELTSVFGANWATTVYWSIASTTAGNTQGYTLGAANSPTPSPGVIYYGTNGTATNTSAQNVLWISVPTTSSFVPTVASANTQSNPAGAIDSMISTFDGGGTPGSTESFIGTNSGNGAYTDEENGNGSYSSPYNYFSSAGSPSSIEVNGPGYANLYQLVGYKGIGPANAGQNGIDIGEFELESSGTFIEVPEPSTYVLFGLGGLGLLFIARRRMARLGLLG